MPGSTSQAGLDETLVSVSISRISRSKFLVSVSSWSRKMMFENSRSRLGLEITILEKSRSRLGLEMTISEESQSRLGLEKRLIKNSRLVSSLEFLE